MYQSRKAGSEIPKTGAYIRINVAKKAEVEEPKDNNGDSNSEETDTNGG